MLVGLHGKTIHSVAQRCLELNGKLEQPSLAYSNVLHLLVGNTYKVEVMQ